MFVYGQDVGGKYGNAFLLLRPLLNEFGDRILNSPLAEGAILGVAVGAALAGQRPIGEIQFNDFVATGFNQLVNNAAKIRYRWGGEVPMVVRMPFGGLRHAGPYHSQNTEAWFYRTPGLKIVVPSTPHDARALMAAAVADPDPVLYYEHIALYRDPRIKQVLSDEPPTPIADWPRGASARRARPRHRVVRRVRARGSARRATARRRRDRGGVLDLRSLAPLDRAAVAGPGAALPSRARRARRLADGRASARALPQSFRKRRSSGSTRRCGSSARSTRRSRIRRRSRSSSCRASGRSNARPACSSPTSCDRLLDWADVSSRGDRARAVDARTLGDAARGGQRLPTRTTRRRRSAAPSSCSPCRWCSRC